MLQSGQEITRLTGRPCGGFPGIGRTLPARHSPRTKLITRPLLDGSRIAAQPARSWVPCAGQSSCPSRYPDVRYDVWDPPWLWGGQVLGGRPERTLQSANTVHHAVLPAIRPTAA